jgi:hypothetical protein
MLGGVVLSSFVRVVFCLHMMAVRQVSVMPGFLVVARIVVLGGSYMVLRSLLMVLCCLAMMFSGFFRHGLSSLLKIRTPTDLGFRG